MLASVLKYFVDGLVDPNAARLGGLQLMHAVPLAIVLIAAWQGVGSFLGNYFLARVSMGVVHDLRVALFDSLLRLPDRYYDSRNSGHLISRITFNVTMVTGNWNTSWSKWKYKWIIDASCVGINCKIQKALSEK